MFDIKEELKNLPAAPGVYLMHSADGTIIYVGKAKNLKNRVSQYFRAQSGHTPKVRAMVSHIARFEYIVTDTETEALVLECNLIKKHRPKYNILLKDDKHYPFLMVTMQEDYPRISIVRKTKNDGARYFGPYLGVNTINNTLEIIQKIFTPPTCRRKFPEDAGKGRPCLNYHIKNCFAPCRGNVSQKEYKAVFEEICKFLDGNHSELRETLEQRMKEASAKLEFEKAAILRDRIKSIDRLDEKQKIFDADKSEDRDIAAVAAEGDIAFVEVFFVRGGKVTGREAYEINNADGFTEQEVLEDFVKQFYGERTNIPAELILEYDISDKELLEALLRERRKGRFRITVPLRGEKVRLTELVKKNAQIEIDNYKIRKIRANKNRVMEELQKTLKLEKEPHRIECYDISNISGADSVGFMVVFENGKKAPSLYRNFRIKTVEGADDYASTSEVIYRRIRRAIEEEEQISKGELAPGDAKFLPLPDVIFADGGKGHVRVIKETLESMDTEIPVFGLVKDDRHRTRGVVSDEGEINLLPTGVVFNFLTCVQDEVHRGAVSYFRKLHTKKSFHSELDNIPGVGKARRNALINRFGSIGKIKEASLEELTSAVDKRTAENILKYFKGGM
ncbi:MAG: excinuclease ABC subunit UvrC [Clostridia bacterium]|nr:excinuclease ABC subunit UvrC [Clostridia bacterium]